MPRPSKFNGDRAARILDALRNGNTRRAAAEAVGVDQNTLGRWLHRYVDFADAVKEAEAEAEQHAVKHITSAFEDGTWTAAAWWLERRHYKDWGKVDRIEVTLRQRAEALSKELGCDAADLIAEAERIAAGVA